MGVRPRGLPLWHPAVLFATGFGAGLSPFARGTCASLAALPFAWAIRSHWGADGLAVAAALVITLGWWAAATSSITIAPGSSVPLASATVAAPLDPLAYALAFLLFRLFDIWKPWPVRWADRHIKGGLGIMLDDLLAAVYAVLVLAVLQAIGGVSGVRR